MRNRISPALALIFCCSFVFGQKNAMFEQQPSSRTGVTFENTLRETPASNVLTYEYFYNGGGVAVGDVNNDGLEDLYFTANMGPNKLYINQGGFSFRDVTDQAGVGGYDGWKTGVSMADVNGDGLLDIYVCYSGKSSPDTRRNQLFINNGPTDLPGGGKGVTFTERAREYGLDDPSYSTQAAFFDMDRDGDLDMYLVNHNVTVIRSFEFGDVKNTRDPYAGDKLFRNDNGRFTDISQAAGIKGNPLGFGLGISVSDINNDGWPDLYVTNDYVEPDYLYINNQDGTFSDRLTDYMQHISHFSMGCDVSDFNNDGLPDIFTLDMLPEDNKRQKLLYGPDNYEHYALMVLNGFYFQNMRNMLHLNNGDGTYSEIGQFAGISNTDWSWAPLFADYDNDGWKDVFITNGYYRDYTNRDFMKYKGDYYFEKAKNHEPADTFHLVTSMSSTPVHNYAFHNNGDLTFTDVSEDWGFRERNFSNGSVYADLDNDGDLDLVVNNQNEPASLYKNLSKEHQPERHFIQLSLTGAGKNTRALGARVKIYAGGQVQFFEISPTRGFQSSVSYRIHAGLGATAAVDSIRIDWPSGKELVLYKVPANQLLKVNEDESKGVQNPQPAAGPKIFTKVPSAIDYQHVEQGFNDFKRQPLLMTMLTTCGPVLALGDVNGDGLQDVYVGGAQETPGKLYTQDDRGGFQSSAVLPFDPRYTDADALFFDADGDGDQDLYVVSGGYNEYTEKDNALQDRLYLNNGSGKFGLAQKALPDMRVSKSCVTAADFDGDGDLDLFVGGRVIPGKYPLAPESFLLENKGGRFESVAAKVAPDLAGIGMVTDAEWVDLNKDGRMDLVLAGEFMPIEVFLNEGGRKLVRATDRFFDRPLAGLWNRLAVYDFDGDGDEDILAGNFGLNTQLKANAKEPTTLVYKDFDKNGSVDPILNCYIQGKSYPFASREELLDQIYSLRSKFTSYESYSDAQLQNIFSKGDLKNAGELEITVLESLYFENLGNRFEPHSLPVQAQFSPGYAIALTDYNQDGNMDFILAGNQSSIRIRMGVIDANFGQLFQGDGKGHFQYVPQTRSGLRLTGDTKSLQVIRVQGMPYLLAGVNNVGVEMYRLNADEQPGNGRGEVPKK